MKITCLSNVSDSLKNAVSKKLGLPENVQINTKDLVHMTELYCVQNNIDTIDHKDYEDEISDYIADQIDYGRNEQALLMNVTNGINCTQQEFDDFYEKNQMLLNEPIDKSPENMQVAMQAIDMFKGTQIINLQDGRILISFPEFSFGNIYRSPYKIVKNDKLRKGYTDEMAQIKIRAIERGDFMLAPNGNKSNLNERQWLQVRTKAFKRWFGDWESVAARIANAKVIWGHPGIGKTEYYNNNNNVIDFDSVYKPRINKELGLPEGAEERKKWRREHRDEYRQKILSLFDEAVKDAKKQGKQLLVSDMVVLQEREDVLDIITQMSEDAFAKRSVQRNEPYDNNKKLWKTDIDESIAKVSDKSKVVNTEKYLSELYEDAKNVSKVVDENGEPLEVYHYTDAVFDTFDKTKPIKHGSFFGKGFYFTTDKKYASIFGKKEIGAFLNLRNPLTEETDDDMDDQMLFRSLLAMSGGIRSVAEYSNKYGLQYDGVIATNILEDNAVEYVASEPNQIKSATDNDGGFRNEDNSILHDIRTNSEYQEMLDELSLSRDKTDDFVYNFVTKILNVNPRYKVDENTDAFAYWFMEKDAVNPSDFASLTKRIFGYHVGLDTDTRGKFHKSVKEALKNWGDNLQKTLQGNNDDKNYLSGLYNSLYKAQYNIKLLQRFLNHGLDKNSFTQDEINSIDELLQIPDNEITKQKVGFKIQKIKQGASTTEQEIQRVRNKIFQQRLAAKNRIVALNVIDNIKDLVEKRLLAEYDSRSVKQETIKEKLQPLQDLYAAIQKTIESKKIEAVGLALFNKATETLSSYEELQNAVFQMYPQYENLLKLMHKANPELKIYIGGEPQRTSTDDIIPGHFDPGTNELHLSNIADIHTVIHELAHSATYYGIVGQQGENGVQFKESIGKFMDYIREYIKEKQLQPELFKPISIWRIPADVYGFTNESEFIAELFGNPEFQELLDLIPAMDEKQFRSILGQIWDAIVKFLNSLTGKNKLNKTALDQARELGYASMFLQQQHLDYIYESLDEYKNHKKQDIILQGTQQSVPNFNEISDKTVAFGVELNKGGAKTMQSDAKKWQESNSDGIVAYRKYQDTPKTFTPETVQEGWIGNPFSVDSKGASTVQKFGEWLITGNTFGEERANEEFRQAIISKILATPEDAKVLYYTELKDRPSHATVIGYLVRNKQLLQQPQVKQVVGENISSKGSEFAKKLTNPKNDLKVVYKGREFRNAEHAYQTWKSGEFDEVAYKSKADKPRGSKPADKNTNYQTMVEIITAKLEQHPELIRGIEQRGGVGYLEASTHDVTGDKYWESSGQNKFIEALIDAYRNVHKETKPTTFSTSKSSYYTDRTKENADWSDITIAVAADFNTLGEKSTKKHAENSSSYSKQYKKNLPRNKYVPLPIGSDEVNWTFALDAIVHRNGIDKTKPVKINFAGNGLYTLLENGYTQEQANDIAERILRYIQEYVAPIEEVRSGGQTGMDEAGIIAAQKLGIKTSVVTTNDWKFRVPKKIFDEKYKNRVQKGEFEEKNGVVDIKNRRDLFEERFNNTGETNIQVYNGEWTRESAENDHETLYVFTDNTDRNSGSGEIEDNSWYSRKYGKGHHFPKSTTAQIRGLENARPISTVHYFYKDHGFSHPVNDRTSNALWHDSDINEFSKVIESELKDIANEFKSGKYKRIVFPSGDGLFNAKISAITKERTPKLYEELGRLLKKYGFESMLPNDLKTSNSETQNIKKSEIHKQNLIRILNQHGKHVKYDDDFKKNHIYWVIEKDGKKVKANSVSEEISDDDYEGIEGTAPFLQLGDEFDDICRWFFNGKEGEVPRTMNITGELKQSIILDLEKVKQGLDNFFKGLGTDYSIITKEYPIASVRKNGKYVAGTPDMIIVDGNGNVYIFDFKTFSSREGFEDRVTGKQKGQGKYRKQVSSYTDILSTIIPDDSGMRVTNSVMGLIAAEVTYPSTTGGKGTHANFEVDEKNGNIIMEKKAGKSGIRRSMQFMKGFNIKVVPGDMISNWIRSVSYQNVMNDLKSLSPEDKINLLDLPDDGFVPEFVDSQKDPEKEDQKKKDEGLEIDVLEPVEFEEDKPISDVDVVKISKRLVKTTSMYIDLIYKDNTGRVARAFIGPDMVEIDDTLGWINKPKWNSPKDIVMTPGLYEKIFNNVIALKFPMFDSDRNEWLNMKSKYLLNISFADLKRIENIRLSPNGSVVEYEDGQLTDAELYELVSNGLEGQIEAYDIDKRTQNVKEHMPQVMKRKLFKIPRYVYDANGKAITQNGFPLFDRDEYKLPDFVGEDEVIQVLYDNLHGMRSLEDMKRRMAELTYDYPWINEILHWLDFTDKDYDAKFEALFYKILRTSHTNYCKIYTEDEKQDDEKITKYIIEPLGKKHKTKQKSKEVMMNFAHGESTGIFDVIEGSSDVGFSEQSIDELKEFKERIEQIANDKSKFVKKDAIDILKGKKYYGMNTQDEPGLLEELNIYLEDYSGLFNAVTKKGDSKNNDMISMQKIRDALGIMINTLQKKLDKGINRISLSDSNMSMAYNMILNQFGAFINDKTENVAYDDGKNFMTHTQPSFIQDVIDELGGEDIPSTMDQEQYKDGNIQGIFDNPQHRYNKYRQFSRKEYERDDSGRIVKNPDGSKKETGRRIYVSSWLRRLSENGEARQIIKHFVHTSTDEKTYFKQSDDLYNISMLIAYFQPSEKNSFGVRYQDVGLFKVPIMSDKNTQEWILFQKEAVIDEANDENLDNMKSKIAQSAKEFLYFELQRMKSVLYQLRKGDPNTDVINFHINRKDKNGNADKVAQSLMKGNVTIEKLVGEDGYLHDQIAGSGLCFKYLPMLNSEIEGNTEFGKAVIDVLNAKNSEIDSKMEKVNGLFEKAFISGMDAAYKHFRKTLSGKVIQALQSSVEDMAEEEIEYKLQEFFYNDTLAMMNIFNLTVIDPAFYKNTTELQKRFAQVHSQTQKVNTEVVFRDEDGQRRRFSDGKFRFVIIKDLETRSDLENVTRKLFEKMYESEIELNGIQSQKAKEYKLLMESVPKMFRNVNVTDGQAYNSMTSMWKKLHMLGVADNEIDEFFKAVKDIGNGNMSLRNFNIVLQTFKPFAYGFTERFNDKDFSSDEQKMLVPMQLKDSETLIFLAGAILYGANDRSNPLSAIYHFMEESAYSQYGEGYVEKQYGGRQNLMHYNSMGVDTIVFESAVKTGSFGVVDINGMEYDDIIKTLKDASYDESGTGYNIGVVHEMDFQCWGIQQNVPEHMQDHIQDIGSQMKVLQPSDIPDVDYKGKPTKITVPVYDSKGNKTGKTQNISKQRFIKEYLGFVNDDFKYGIDQVAEELGMKRKKDGSLYVVNRKKFNKALSDIAKNDISNDQKYSIELFKSMLLDNNDEFISPVADPQIAEILYKAVFGMIKNNVNKQQVPGGPVVQMCPFGLNDNLHIIDGNGLTPKDENFNPLSGLTYECYITAPTMEIERAITFSEKKKYKHLSHEYKNGDILDMKDIMDNELLTEDQLEFIAYRIPTEDKYSIYRMKIKGFLSRRSGEIIIMPSELTALSGTDFDIDKMYCWFRKKKGKDKELTKRDILYNKLFDYQWAIGGHESTAEKQLNPGNYDLLKEIAEEVDPKTKGESDSLMYPHNQTRLKKLNSAGKNFVGIGALNNTCHAISTYVNIKISYDSMPKFKINGVYSHDIMETGDNDERFFQFDPIDSRFDGSRISKTLSMFVGAAADNAKDAVLGRLNITPNTANVAMAMIRIGIPVRTVSYILTMPKVIQISESSENSGQYFEDAIGEAYAQMISELTANSNGHDIQSIVDSIQKTNITDSNIAKLKEGKLSKKDEDDLNNSVLMLLKNMSVISRDMSGLNTILSLNSTKNAVGPSIYETLSTHFKIERFIDMVSQGKTVFTDDIIDNIHKNTPFIETLIQCYHDITADIISQFSPIYGKSFLNLMKKISMYETDENVFSEKNIKNMINGFFIYVASKKGVIDTSEQGRIETIYEFPLYFMSNQDAVSGNDFILSMQVLDQMNKKNKIPCVNLDMIGLPADTINMLQASWNKLVQLPKSNKSYNEMKKLSQKIVFYMAQRFGFTWMPNSALNVASNTVKLNIDGYKSIFEPYNGGWSDIDTEIALDQYARNNPKSGLWKGVYVYQGKYIDINEYNSNVYGYKDMYGNMYSYNGDKNNPTTTKKTFRVGKGKEKRYVTIDAVELTRVQRLGIDNNFLEYDANASILSPLKTVITDANTKKYTEWFNNKIKELNMNSEDFVEQGYMENKDNPSPSRYEKQTSPNDPNMESPQSYNTDAEAKFQEAISVVKKYGLDKKYNEFKQIIDSDVAYAEDFAQIYEKFIETHKGELTNDEVKQIKEVIKKLKIPC